MREHQKTEVYYLLQSEELQSDESIRRQKSSLLLQSEELLSYERASEDRSLLFITV